MAIRDYRDFVLIADQVEKANGVVTKFRVSVFDSPVGQGEKSEIVTLPTELLGRARQLASEERALDRDLPRQMQLGMMLGEALLPPYARELYRRSRDRLCDDDGLRLRL